MMRLRKQCEVITNIKVHSMKQAQTHLCQQNMLESQIYSARLEPKGAPGMSKDVREHCDWSKLA